MHLVRKTASIRVLQVRVSVNGAHVDARVVPKDADGAVAAVVVDVQHRNFRVRVTELLGQNGC